MGAETANTTATVLRGTTSNWAGDTVDAGIPVLSGLPVTLIETGKNIQDPSTPTPRIVREITCIVPAYAGVLNTDQIVDEATGEKFIVLAVTRPPTIIGAPTDRVLNLRRVEPGKQGT
jgi:hypothetical protein